MKLIKPSYNIITQELGLEGIFKQIELAGRTCYKSEDKITPDSAKEFVERMIKSGHGAMLEHGTVYLAMPEPTSEVANLYKYLQNPYSKVKILPLNGAIYITTNYRVLVKNSWLDDLQYLCEPTGYHEKRVSVRFFCDIGVSREFNRHRVDSIAEQSTRYCNLSKDKFNNEVTFIQPNWTSDTDIENSINMLDIDGLCKSIVDGYIDDWRVIDYWIFALKVAEFCYMGCINNGWSPQQARDVLPLSTKTELVHTAFVSDWKHFFSLRDASAAHPQAFELAHPLHEEFKNLNLI
jgi:thymidylate synthase (FAD)